MGSQGIKRRPRPRPRPGGGGEDPRRNWELQNSPYTFEGQMEGLRRFGGGLSSASPGMRLTAKVVAAVFILSFVTGIMAWVFD